MSDDFIFVVFFLFRDNAMNINEFTALIKALFRNEKGKPYPIDTHMITEIFNIFNKSGVRISNYKIDLLLFFLYFVQALLCILCASFEV